MKVYPVLTRPDLLFFRLHGAGLGNLFFPYFRAFVYAKEFGYELIPPPWAQIKLNQLKHIGTSRCRLYANIFRRPGGLCRILEDRYRAIWGGAGISEVQWKEAGCPDIQNKILLVEGMDDFFEPLLPFRAEIREHYIRQLLRSEVQSQLQGEYAAFHLRLGDFVSGELAADRPNVSLGLDHALEIVKSCSEALGMPFWIVTDADSEQCQKLVAAGAKVFRGKNFLDELNVLVGARVLVASCSTMSMWSAFLGAGKVARPARGFWKLPSVGEIKEARFSGAAEVAHCVKSLL